MLSVFRYVVAIPIVVVALVGTSILRAAQQPTTITGVVSDQTGASIAGAKVELRERPNRDSLRCHRQRRPISG